MRFLKQLLYAILYLSILFGIGVAGYFGFLKPEPSCFDGILNQDEEGIDCGPSTSSGQVAPGGCIPCELKHLEMEIESIRNFSLSESTSSVAVKISNPSENYGTPHFEYIIDLYNKSDSRIKRITGESSLYPAEEKYIVVSGLDIDARLIDRVEFNLVGRNIDDMGWIEKKDMPELPDVEIRDVESVREDDVVILTGTIYNNSPVGLTDVDIYSIGIGLDGSVLSASSTLVEELRSFSEADFRIFMPGGNYSGFETNYETL